jgi:hypothetical protein
LFLDHFLAILLQLLLVCQHQLLLIILDTLFHHLHLAAMVFNHKVGQGKVDLVVQEELLYQHLML